MKRFKAGDYLIIAVVIGLIIFLFSRSYSLDGAAKMVEITGSDFSGTYDPQQSLEVEVMGPLGVTVVNIEDGEAWVSESPCRDKICIKMGKVARPGEHAVCIPNRVIVQMAGARDSIDGISR
jgi:hypothetical protein